jgi:hypothetical protein
MVTAVIVPNSEKAYIPSAKLKDYLLSSSHAVGKSKAKFFREFGFNESNVHLLETGLLSIVFVEDVTNVTVSLHGTKYTVDGLLLTPTGTTVHVRTIWILETDQNEPRFVTAHPLPKE